MIGNPWLNPVLLLGAIWAAVACSYIPNERLEYTPISSSSSIEATLVIGVERIVDERPPPYATSYFGRLFLTYIPLLPYVSIPAERLDEVKRLRDQRLGHSPRA